MRSAHPTRCCVPNHGDKTTRGATLNSAAVKQCTPRTPQGSEAPHKPRWRNGRRLNRATPSAAPFPSQLLVRPPAGTSARREPPLSLPSCFKGAAPFPPTRLKSRHFPLPFLLPFLLRRLSRAAGPARPLPTRARAPCPAASSAPPPRAPWRRGRGRDRGRDRPGRAAPPPGNPCAGSPQPAGLPKLAGLGAGG